jgi:2,4-dienoyl-CoA reductase-like NADH-dependent reductase (Old Yellow Enzyme family)
VTISLEPDSALARNTTTQSVKTIVSKLFPNLFSSFEIKGKRFKNRLFLPAHGTGYAESGGVGGQGFAYYKARVSRGIGLLITEASQVVALTGQKYPQLSFATDDCISRVSALAKLCAEHDCRYFAQLYHEGRARAHSLDGSREVAVAPSALPDERHHIMPRAMTAAMIDDLISHFASPARRAYVGGTDGIELLVGMGYLHAQFLSPRTNIRTDKYGGSVTGRGRFLARRYRLFVKQPAKNSLSVSVSPVKSTTQTVSESKTQSNTVEHSIAAALSTTSTFVRPVPMGCTVRQTSCHRCLSTQAQRYRSQRPSGTQSRFRSSRLGESIKPSRQNTQWPRDRRT